MHKRNIILFILTSLIIICSNAIAFSENPDYKKVETILNKYNANLIDNINNNSLTTIKYDVEFLLKNSELMMYNLSHDYKKYDIFLRLFTKFCILSRNNEEYNKINYLSLFKDICKSTLKFNKNIYYTIIITDITTCKEAEITNKLFNYVKGQNISNCKIFCYNILKDISQGFKDVNDDKLFLLLPIYDENELGELLELHKYKLDNMIENDLYSEYIDSSGKTLIVKNISFKKRTPPYYVVLSDESVSDSKLFKNSIEVEMQLMTNRLNDNTIHWNHYIKSVVLKNKYDLYSSIFRHINNKIDPRFIRPNIFNDW